MKSREGGTFRQVSCTELPDEIERLHYRKNVRIKKIGLKKFSKFYLSICSVFMWIFNHLPENSRKISPRKKFIYLIIVLTRSFFLIHVCVVLRRQITNIL